ncbi:MAG: hypothetical protein WCJ72_11855 [Chryseobacterium sp.]
MRYFSKSLLGVVFFGLVLTLKAKALHQSDEINREDSTFEYHPPKVALKIPSNCPVAKVNIDGTAFKDPSNKCSFYACAAETADQSKVCSLNDQSSYFFNYGEKYCKRFSDKTAKGLSDGGRVWLNKTLACLQGSILEGCNQKKQCSDCQSIRKLAFDTHPHCYVSSGLCSLSLLDQMKVGLTVDAGDLFTGESFAQAGSVAASCGSEYAKKGLDAASSAFRSPVAQASAAGLASLTTFAQKGSGWTKGARYVSSDSSSSNSVFKNDKSSPGVLY